MQIGFLGHIFSVLKTKDELKASRAYDFIATLCYGEYARLNHPMSPEQRLYLEAKAVELGLQWLRSQRCDCQLQLTHSDAEAESSELPAFTVKANAYTTLRRAGREGVSPGSVSRLREDERVICWTLGQAHFLAVTLRCNYEIPIGVCEIPICFSLTSGARRQCRRTLPQCDLWPRCEPDHSKGFRW